SLYKNGYTFAGWKVNGGEEIKTLANSYKSVATLLKVLEGEENLYPSKTYNLVAQWTPNTDTKYYIRLYIQKETYNETVLNTEYEEISVETKTGTTGDKLNHDELYEYMINTYFAEHKDYILDYSVSGGTIITGVGTLIRVNVDLKYIKVDFISEKTENVEPVGNQTRYFTYLWKSDDKYFPTNLFNHTLGSESVSGWINPEIDTENEITSTVNEYVTEFADAYNFDAESISLVAVWDSNPYTINYEAVEFVGENVVFEKVTTGIVGKEVNITNPIRQGWTFAGWTATGISSEAKAWNPVDEYWVNWDGSRRTNQKYLNLADVGGTVTLTANWTENNYIISIDNQTIERMYTSVEPFTIGIPTSLTAPVGQKFDYWKLNNGTEVEQTTYTIKDFVTKYNSSIQIEKNITISAVWTDILYTLKTIVDGTTTIVGENIAFSSDVNINITAQKIGHTFAGWTAIGIDTNTALANGEGWLGSATFATVFKSLTTTDGDTITLTATWTINPYTITFANTGDTTIAPITQDYGTAVTAPSNPTKT
ncbi:MAG: InlB B-repeat-containing protein, partial [Clostridia bacterium]|nr:InlB B-repeat-containing protein [Clostridia bacterium]